MIIEYINGEIIVTHESGHVDTYQQADIERIKARTQDFISRLTDQTIHLDNHIVEIRNSIGV